MLYFSTLALTAIVNVFLFRAYAGHGRQTVAYVLLGFCVVAAVLAVVAVPVLIYRSSRSRDSELMQ